MKRKKPINASDIGKTLYCPHSHYLSKIHKVGANTQTKLAYGNKKHNQVSRVATKQDKGSFVAGYVIITVIIVLYVLYVN
jgi:hypothetical protein